MFCKKCGKESIDENSEFCWNCGNRIKSADNNFSMDNSMEKNITDETGNTIDVNINTTNVGVKKIGCKNCDYYVYEKADVCPNCGMKLRAVVINNPGVAGVLSFFIPGLGQIYGGEVIIGVISFIIEISLLGIGYSLLRIQEGYGYIFIVITIVLWICNIFIAYKLTERINKKQYN